MRYAKAICFVLLIVYTLCLVYAELRYSQDFARNFFSDIYGPTIFFGINTTLSASLLWCIALVFGISGMFLERKPGQRRTRVFYVSQVLMFCYLGVDDRFRLHEWVDQHVPHGEALVLVGAAIVEAYLVIFVGDLRKWSKRTRLYLGIGAVLSGVMMFIDLLLPTDWVLRLSCEDLSKVWAEVFLFMFALEILRAHIDELKSRASSHSAASR